MAGMAMTQASLTRHSSRLHSVLVLAQGSGASAEKSRGRRAGPAAVGARGREWVASHWPEERMVRHYVGIYELLLEDPSLVRRQKDLSFEGGTRYFHFSTLPDLIHRARADTFVIADLFDRICADARCRCRAGHFDHDVLHRFDPLRPQRLLVTRPCYLALRRAIGVPFVPDHVVLISEHQRCLTECDVSLALALPVTSVPDDPAIARAIDAGLLAARLPRCLANAIAQLPV